MRIFAKALLFFMTVLCSGYCIASDCGNGNKVSLCISAEAGSGIRLDGVEYKKRAIDGARILKFARASGLRVIGRDGRPMQGAISSAQFVAAMKDAVARLESSGNGVDEVQFDIDLVSDFWADIKASVRYAVANGSGALQNKDRDATLALRRAIKRSALLKGVCEMIVSRRMRCDPANNFIEAIAFQDRYRVLDRKVISAAEDVGISRLLGVSITFQKIGPN